MEYNEFYVWLKSSKNMGDSSARDVVSRLKRVLKIVGKTNLTDDSLSLLISSPEFPTFSRSVKSQLKRSVSLYLEYSKK